jgi:hypothetical protein
MSETLKKDILRTGSDDKEISKKATQRVVQEIRQDPSQRYLMGTSQAVDIVNGGVKGISPPENSFYTSPKPSIFA